MKFFVKSDYMSLDSFVANFSIIGLAVGSVMGLTAVSLSKSFSQEMVMPLLGPIFGFERWKDFRLKIWKFNFGVGHFLSELIYFIIVAGLIYIIFAFFLKGFLKRVLNNKKSSDIALESSQKDIIKHLNEIKNDMKKNTKDQSHIKKMMNEQS